MDLREKEWRASAATHFTSGVYRSNYHPYQPHHYVDSYVGPRYYGAAPASPIRYSSPSRTVVVE